MAAQLLVVGLEAMERDLAQRLVAAGRMPNLERLERDGLTAEMANPIGLVSGPVWGTIATGLLPDHHDRLNWRVLRAGTYRVEHLGPTTAFTSPPLWRTLAAQGVSSLVIDVPTVALDEHPLITQLIDWHTHDRRELPTSSPPSLAREIAERFAPVDVDRCDFPDAADDLPTLRAKILRDVEEFATAVPWLMERADADVVVACVGASHCAGHQFWHLHDETSARHDASARAALGDVVEEVYEALDAALGRILDTVDPSCTVAVVLSHGMGDNCVMPHHLDPIVRAIDEAMGPPGRWHQAREFARRAPNRIARRLLRLLRRPSTHLAYILDGSRRFLPVDNFPTHGAVRCNVIGREPNGRVSREELPSVLDRLEAELLATRDAATGEPVVRRVIRTADHYDNVDGSGMADLLVEWEGQRVVETVTSPTIGTIHRPDTEWRSGAHRQDGLVVLCGPGIPAGVSTAFRAVDLWPTLATMVGVDPGDVDGVPVPEVALATSPTEG